MELKVLYEDLRDVEWILYVESFMELKVLDEADSYIPLSNFCRILHGVERS
ncbi:hypothetical protein Mcup_1086 [Metallosphaera cuprina Ar-4]|uniref:Uncharacterized protein n=1 Tax=Metallosphaera cuprina (strain Ar-4) TaxID=1006006 RepID=F4G2Z3_METCR|nr:hypothetical protein Mcup_1086 [Metallosphaera cuprina Ar-4]